MNSKNEAGAVELMLLAGMALLWACLTVVRLLVVPVVALLVVLLTPRRRPAPQPAAVASVEAPEAQIAAPEAVEPEAAAAPAEPVLAPLTLATIGAELLELPAAELRRLAGTRRRLPKRELAALICAMPL